MNMHNRRFRTFLMGVVAVLAIAASTALPAQQRPVEPQLLGTVEAVSTDGRTITVNGVGMKITARTRILEHPGSGGYRPVSITRMEPGQQIRFDLVNPDGAGTPVVRRMIIHPVLQQ